MKRDPPRRRWDGRLLSIYRVGDSGGQRTIKELTSILERGRAEKVEVLYVIHRTPRWTSISKCQRGVKSLRKPVVHHSMRHLSLIYGRAGRNVPSLYINSTPPARSTTTTTWSMIAPKKTPAEIGSIQHRAQSFIIFPNAENAQKEKQIVGTGAARVLKERIVAKIETHPARPSAGEKNPLACEKFSHENVQPTRKRRSG